MLKESKKKRISINTVTAGIILVLLVIAAPAVFGQEEPRSPLGANAVPDLYSPALAGEGAFTTSTGGASASAVNPAQGGDARRMVFEAGYQAIPRLGWGDELNNGYMQSLSLGALFPTKVAVFGASIRYIGGFGDGIEDGIQFYNFPVGPTFGGNLNVAKEIYPGMSLGMGLNFGAGAGMTISGDLGFRYNRGALGPLNNFTMAVVLGNLGVSYSPQWLAPALGVSFDLVRVKGGEDKPDPFIINFCGDLVFPSAFYPPEIDMIFKTGLKFTFLEIVNLSVAWPGGSGLSVRERSDNVIGLTVLPSIGLTVNIALPSSNETLVGGRLPTDGDLKVHGAFKPLYEGVSAVGGGVTWYAGIADKKPPVIETEYKEPIYFSPNNDGKADFMELPVTITDQSFIDSWSMEIKDERGNVIRTIENKEQRFDSFNAKEFFSRIVTSKKQIDIPPVMRWDGLTNSGSLAPDGKYFVTITASDELGNTAVSQVFEAVLKNTPPVIAINPLTDAQRIFDPKGQGGNSAVIFNHRGSEEDAWQGEIYNASGEKIRTFEPLTGAPGPQIWDGRTDSGQVAPDGVYSYKIGTTDKAMNSASAEMTNIILDSREAGAFLTASVNAIAPRPNQSTNIVDFNIRLLLQDGINNWKLELKDETGNAQKTFTGTGRVPATQGWNGLTDQGAIREGLYSPVLTVNYTRGDVVSATATNVLVDVTGPELAFTYTPEYFSPDNDGVDDELFITLTARDRSPIANWVVEIKEPEAPYPLFKRIEGRGTPAARIVWDGRSDKGELVQSATDYPYTYTATDVLGNSSTIEGKIGVDVLVIRDGDRLKIQIPSIVFRANAADFEGLPRETVDNNTRILRRIAQILNNFRDYRVQVEGHANPTQPAGAARDREQPELQRLSEARARAVVDILVRYGVSRGRLSSFGVGGSSPVVAFEDRDNWWKNRRVEFILIK